MKGFTMEGPSAEDWQKMMKAWTSGVPGMTEGVEAWQKLMLTAMSAGVPKRGEDKGD
jgi:hypothetical protein